MLNINLILFTYINGFAGKYYVLDWFFIAVTSYWMQMIVFSLVTLYIVVYLPFREQDQTQRFHYFGQAAEMVFVLMTTWLLTTALKVAVALPRPFEVVQGVHALVRDVPGQSFPSAHTALTCALAYVVLPHHTRLGRALWVFALLVGFSRIFVGVHYPLDVFAGAVIGLGIVKCFERISWIPHLSKKPHN